LLGTLQDNGGQTDTRALGVGSPAIDAGDSTACPATDQRGIARYGAACDIGAFEYVPPAPTTTLPPTTTTQITPPPPAPPRCTLRAKSHRLRHGRLQVLVACDQSVALKVTGKLTEKPRRGHKRKLALHALTASGVTTGPLNLKLPSAAARALKQKARESVTLTLTWSNANGTGKATLTIVKLKR